jgi:penicillin-binding protein 1A
VAIAWVGFDQPKTLGKNQTGGVVALPIWVGYMERVLHDIPEMTRTTPPGVVSVPTMQFPSQPGEAARTVPEYFYREAVPPPEVLQPPPPEPPPAPVLPPEQANPPT